MGKFGQPGEPALPVRSWRKALGDHAAEVSYGGHFVHAPASHELPGLSLLYFSPVYAETQLRQGGGLAAGRLAPISDGAHILGTNPSAPHTTLTTAEQRGDLADRHVGRKESDEQRDRQVALVLAVRVSAVRDEAVVLFIESQGVVFPPQLNIAPPSFAAPYRKRRGPKYPPSIQDAERCATV